MPLPTGHRLAARHRAVAIGGGLVAVWGLGGGLAWLFSLGGVDGFLLLVPAAALAALGGGLAWAGRAARVASACLTLALAFLVAGHLLGPLGGPFWRLFPPWLLLASLPVVLLAGWRAHALDLAARETGRPPPLLPRVALGERAWVGVLARLADGLGLAGIVALDAASSLRTRTRVRLDVELGVLAAALSEAGAAAEPRGRHALDVALPDEAGSVRVVRVRLRFPSHARALDLQGEAHAVRRAVLLLESLAVGHYAWTAQGRRFEARLHAMARDAARARTLEERSLLAEEAERLERILDARDLPHDEWLALRAWATQRLRLQLATQLLSEPVGPRTEGRVLSPAPALAPELATLLDAGGLAGLRRLVYVPHWILPVRDRWGEREVLVNALTHKPDLAHGAAVLHAARARAPSLFLDAPSSVQFLPAPEPTAAVLRELREALPRADVAPAVAGPAEWLLVPYVPTPEGYVNAVTGARAPDLGAPAAIAAAR